MNFLGIEIGGTKLQVVAGASTRILDRQRFRIEPEAGAEGIRRQISSILPEMISKHSPWAVGVGFGGPVDWKTGTIGCSHQIEGWSDFPLREWLVEKTKLPIRIENDANIAAWAEARMGAGVDANPVFYLTLGSGVGGGLVVNGAIYHGAPWGEAEIGQMRLDREGATVESRCAGWAIDQRIREARDTHPESLLFQLMKSETGGEARHLAPALLQHDAFAEEVLHELGGDLAWALSHVVHLMHPEVIVLGGGLSLMGEPLRAAVAEALAPMLMETFQTGTRIALSATMEDAVPLGALLLAENALAAGTV